MRDKTHTAQIERWAKFCIENPNEWKKIQKEFIDAQFAISDRFYGNMLKSKEGKEIVKELRGQRK